jgi:amidophosphoribosyltransferase
MSTVDELFAPKFLKGSELTPEIQAEMAEALEADSLRYLPVESIARAIRVRDDQLCRACITGQYPTTHGQKLYQIALKNAGNGNGAARTYERQLAETAG